MIVQVVKFTSALPDTEALRVMEERASQYRAQPGLLQKYYVREAATGDFGGIYVWDSEDSLRAFRESDLARTIAAAYQVVGQPNAQMFEVLFPLRDTEQAAATGHVASTAT